MKQLLLEFWLFGLKQAWASLFGGCLLAAILLTEFWYPATGLARYDFLFLFAVSLQVLLIMFRLETAREVLVILVFHAVATLMELFKTSPSIGSWAYPGVEQAYFAVGNVPLFAGFMYSAVGSYIARAWRIFDIQFRNYPPTIVTVSLAALIYLNFFSHHYIADFRNALLVGLVLAFGRSWFYFKVRMTHRRMPVLVGLILVALFIWIAENVSTFGSVWIYPTQTDGWQMVPIAKLVAWLLLLVISLVLVALVHKPKPYVGARKGRRDKNV